jgi:ABC-type polysaccharide/polyol phosphate export permease
MSRAGRAGAQSAPAAMAPALNQHLESKGSNNTMQQQLTVRGGETKAVLATRDVLDGLHAYPIWSTLAWQDIRQRYRRSMLGPLWITLTMIVTIAGMGPLYGALLNISMEEFVPYLALGIITWGLISTLILEGCLVFTGADSIVRSVRLPITLHVFRTVYRNLLFFFHNILAYVPVMIYLKIMPRVEWLMALPGLVIIILAAVPLNIILGIFCARFRDMQPIVGSIVQLAFFLTPIFWKPSALGHRAYVADYNPLFMFVELVRAPMYGSPLNPTIYVGACITTLVLYVIAIPLFIRFRSRIAFWI